MAKTEANPPMPRFVDDYVLQTVDADYLADDAKIIDTTNLTLNEVIDKIVNIINQKGH